jgi:hypothetical protein
MALAVAPLAAQDRGYKAPRLAGTQHPDLNGLWQALNTANWDIQDHSAQPAPVLATGAWGAVPAGRGIVEGNEIPYQAWALAKKQENFQKRLTVDPFDFSVGDPELRCFLPGVPRATYMPFPFQIIQSTNQILISYEFADASRLINMGPRREPPTGFWMGWSDGRWEGDTLVVEVTGFNGKAWFDRAGAVHTDVAVPPSVRGDDRGSEGLHSPVEDQPAPLPARRAARAAAGIQVRRVHRGAHLRQPEEER